MTKQVSARNLLSGILALQLKFIDRDQLLAAVRSWVVYRGKPMNSISLGDVLVEQSAVDAETCRLLDELADTSIAKYDGQVEESLRSLDLFASTANLLASVGDSEIEETMRIVTMEPTLDLGQAAPIEASERTIPTSNRFVKKKLHAKGGLGEVSIAEDTELRRTVALKEIQPRYAEDADCRTRFLREAEITGKLEHPGIVPIYGLGQFADRRPYYAMRFIQGESLRDAIDRFHKRRVAGSRSREQELDRRKLLSSFIDVCNAIEYAHSRGILHRDLKPSNIMLGKYGETLVVDWGLAKPIGQADEPEGSEPLKSLAVPDHGATPTRMGSAVGTPAFMSPEQAAGRLDQLGPASDIYSLGATLYYLLTGKTAFEEKDVMILLNKVKSGDFSPARDLCSDIPKALDAICSRAMAVDQGDRYPSCQALADDVERWLADEVTVALPEGAMLRTARWLRKNRAVAYSGVITSLVVTLISIVTAVVVNSYRNETAQQYNIAEIERGRALQLAGANQELADSETAAREVAETRRLEAETAQGEAERKRLEAEAVSDFLISAFRNPDPGKSGHLVTVADTLEQAMLQLDESFPESPLTRATLATAIGTTYRRLGLYPESMAALRTAHQIRADELGARHQETLNSANEFAMATYSAGDRVEAKRQFEEVLEAREAVLGPDHPETVASISNLATACQYFGEYERAIELFQRVLEIRTRTLGPRDVDTLVSMNNLAMVYGAKGDYESASAILAETLRLKIDLLGRRNISTMTTIHNYGHSLFRMEKFEEALPYIEEAYALRSECYGPNHPSAILTLKLLGDVQGGMKKWDVAIQTYTDAIDRYREAVGSEHPDTWNAIDALAVAYRESGDSNASIDLLQNLVRTCRDTNGDDHPETLKRLNNLGWALKMAKRYERAITVLKETVERREEILGQEHPYTMISIVNLAAAYEESKQWEESIALTKRSLEWLVRRDGEESPEALLALDTLARTHRAAGQLDETIELLQKSVELHRRKFGPFAPETLTKMNNLGWVYRAAKQFEKSRSLLEETLKLRKEHLGDENSATVVSRLNLALLDRDIGECSAAIRLYEEVLDIRSRRLGAKDRLTLNVMHSIGRTHLEAGGFDDAVRLLEETMQLRNEVLGPNTTPAIDTAIQLSIAYRHNGQNDKSIALLEEVVRRASKHLGDSHPQTVEAKRALANSSAE